MNGADTGIPAAGTNGANGANGSTPTVSVSDNGNWFINGSDTGIPAKGQDGVAGKNGQDGTTTANTIVIGDNGNWFINGKDTGIPATGSNGANGTNGQPGSVAINPATNTWVINGKDTGIPANGTNGLNGKDAATATIIIGTNGNWHVNGVDTGVPATGAKGERGEKGDQGDQGEKGETGAAGANGQDGAAGQDGTSVGISNTETLPSGDIKVTFSDGKEIVVPKGQDGRDGKDGKTPVVEAVKGADGVTTITFKDPDTGAPIGDPVKVKDGEKGPDGTSVTITNTETLPSGDIKVTFSDGKEIVVPKGQDGRDGKDGKTPVVEAVKGADGVTTITFKDPDTGAPIGDPVKVKDGEKGPDGTSVTITNTETLPSGDIKVTFSDGKEIVVPKGQDGRDGKDGKTPVVEAVKGADGVTTITFKDPDTGAPIGDPVKVKDGEKGPDGTSVTITNTETLPSGDIKVTFSDGKEIVVPKGQDGRDGKDGKTPVVEAVKGADGVTTITFKDPDTGAPIGDPVKVKDGEKGADGTSVTITNTETLPSGDIKVTFSDGKEIIVPKGKDGRDGRDGTNGKYGRDGQPGQPGKDGRDGQPGTPGKDGRDGQTDSNHSTGTNGSVSSHDMQPLAYTSQKATVTSQTSTAQLPNTGVDNAVFLELAGYMTLLGGAMFVNKSRRKK
ncbi:LPXTG cell wall anchor domain-containing protein [Streptococcus sp. E29BA]|uniref:LPXTG cell wall anchor domain-containing protein n=1 Tax=Streptococcus sp. E29BA TaxID=3278716 RepID=UPI00359D5E3E